MILLEVEFCLWWMNDNDDIFVDTQRKKKWRTNESMNDRMNESKENNFKMRK